MISKNCIVQIILKNYLNLACADILSNYKAHFKIWHEHCYLKDKSSTEKVLSSNLAVGICLNTFRDHK